jgi:hypothetical protein
MKKESKARVRRRETQREIASTHLLGDLKARKVGVGVVRTDILVGNERRGRLTDRGARVLFNGYGHDQGLQKGVMI